MSRRALPLSTMNDEDVLPDEPGQSGSSAARSPGDAATVGSADAAPVPDTTGDARVDEALTRLAELDAKPVHEHAAVVEDIHRSLQDALAEGES